MLTRLQWEFFHKNQIYLKIRVLKMSWMSKFHGYLLKQFTGIYRENVF